MKTETLLMLTLFSLWASIPTGAAELTWTGCGITKKAFMKELASAYEKKTGTKVIIKGGGATKGIQAVAKGDFDMGGTCRHKLDLPEEQEALFHHVAWDALVVVVNKDNAIENLTTEQVKRVFTGRILSWKELGGSDAPIRLYVRRGRTSGVGLMMRELLFKDPDQDFSPEALEKRSSGPIEAAVSKDLLGIAATGISSAKKRRHLKILKIDGVTPARENIVSGTYPFFRPLYITTRGEPEGEVLNFIEFALSPAGQAVISAQGTVNLEQGKTLKPLVSTYAAE